MVIVKLGGSVVTLKNSLVPKPQTRVIKQLVSEIKEVVEKGYRLVVVHGAGSYGHPLAKKYQLHKGMETQDQKVGYSKTSLSMLTLNSLIVGEMVRVGIKPVSLPPHAFVSRVKGEWVGLDSTIIKQYLSLGFTPVLFGDAVLDDLRGSAILSGDVIVPYLAKKLKAAKVIFLSDVDGIFDKDPKRHKGAELIKVVNNINIKGVLKRFEPNGEVRADVTGEMEGKILAIKEGMPGIEVRVVSGLRKNSLIDGVEGKQKGTRLIF